MKRLIIALLLAFATTSVSAGGVTKTVCRDVVNNGKVTKVCKKIKVHKKLKGTKIPRKERRK